MIKMKKQLLYLSLIVLLLNNTMQAQNSIEPKNGYTPQTGVIVSMLEDLKSRVNRNVEKLIVFIPFSSFTFSYSG